MNNFFKKILLAIIVILILSSIGGYFIVKSKIKPELVRKMIISSIEKSFPNSKVQIKKVEYKIGFKVEFILNDFKLGVDYKEQVIPLVEVDKIQVFVPVLSILTGGAQTKVKIISPRFFVNKIKKKTNWELVLPKTDTVISKNKKNKLQTGTNLGIPAFLLGNSIGFEVFQSKLKYNLGKKNKGIINLDKFIIKNLNFKTSTAFEVDSSFSIINEGSTPLSFRLLILGELNLGQYLIHRRDAMLKTKIHLQKIMLPNKLRIPNIETDLEILLKQDKSIQANFKSKLLKNFIEGEIIVNQKKISINGINSIFYFDDILKVASKNIPALTTLELHFNGDGELFNSKVKKLSFKWKLIPEYNLNSCIGEISISANGTVKTKSFNLKSKINLLAGNVFSDLRINYDLNKLSNPLKVFRDINLKINSSGITILKNDLKSCYGNSNDNSKITAKKDMDLSKSLALIPMLPNTKVKIKFDKMKLGSHYAVLESRVTIKNRTLNIHNFSLKSGNGHIKLSGHSKVKQKILVSKYKSKIYNFDLNVFEVLIPTPLKTIGGRISSSSTISSRIKRTVNYKIENSTKIKNFYLDGLDLKPLKSKALKYLKKPEPLVRLVRNFNPKSKFKSMAMSLKLNQNTAVIKYLNITQFSDHYNLKSKGSIDFKDVMKKSNFYVDLTDLKQKNMPISMHFTLGFDYKYTMKKFALTQFKLQKMILQKKVKKEAQKAANKKMNKVKKDVGKKLKKLFKGLF